MIRGVHLVLTAFWQPGANPPDQKRGLEVPIWKGKGSLQKCREITLLTVPSKGLAYILLMLKHQKPEESEFMPGKSTIDHIVALSS